MLGVKVSQAAVQRVQDWRFQRVAECITGATCTKIVTLRHYNKGRANCIIADQFIEA